MIDSYTRMAIAWPDVVGSLGGQAILLAAVAWLCKALVSSRLTREADAFRARLRADADTEIERLKSSLQIAATEHQVRFTKLHEERGEVIAKLYELLVGSAAAMRLFAAHPFDVDVGQNARDAHVELFRFVNLKRIYLPVHVSELLNSYAGKLGYEVASLSIYFREREPNPQMGTEQVRVMREAWAAAETELPAIQKELEIEFRKLLGVESASAS